MGIVASMLQAHLVNLDRDKDVEIFIGNKIPKQKDNDNKLYVVQSMYIYDKTFEIKSLVKVLPIINKFDQSL